MTLTLHNRSIDAGCGTQIVLSKDGIIVHQRLVANGSGYYTGDGNPELIGKPVSAMRGMGFRKVQPPKSEFGRARYELRLAEYYAHHVLGTI